MPNGFEQHTLTNGLTIIAEPDGAAHSAAVGFFVKTGARDEPTPLMGVSHFLEHMMFKGTDSMSAADINSIYDDMGARNNAYTSHEMTCFYASVVADRLPEAIDHTAKMMRPALRESDFDTERGVILEEIAMYADNPFWVLYESACERHHGSNPLGHRVLGTPATIQSLTRDSMAAYFDANYAADTSVVALAGRVDFDEACKQIESLCGSWPKSKTPRNRQQSTPQPSRLDIVDDRFDRGYLLMLDRAPSAQDDTRYAANLLAQIFGAQDNSRLHWALIEQGLAEEAQAAFDPGDGTGEFFAYASGDAGQLADIEQSIRNEAIRLADSLREDDLERVRSRFATAFTVSAERPADGMQRIGRRWTTLGEYRSLSEELERIRAVTVSDIRGVLERFPLTSGTIATLRPPAEA
ncbi:MAG: pitrilysin family protein [Planctomycetota bacterium]